MAAFALGYWRGGVIVGLVIAITMLGAAVSGEYRWHPAAFCARAPETRPGCRQQSINHDPGRFDGIIDLLYSCNSNLISILDTSAV
jgi:hypothetical protein